MSSKVLNPIVRWAQDRSVLFLTVDLLDAKEPEIQMTDHSLRFKAFGHGAHGQEIYQFNLLFYKKIYPKQCFHKVTPRHVTFHLQKGKTEDPWPRLLSIEKKPAWLKIDFDKWQGDETSDEEEKDFQNQLKQITVENRSKSDLDRAQDEFGAFVRLAYLAVYNGTQAIAFITIIFRLIMSLVKNGQDGMYSAFDLVGDLLMTCQIAALLEVINPMLGIVKTGVFAPLIQVYGRGVVLFLLVLPEKYLHTSPATFWLFVAWSAIEAVRYPFYLLSLLHIVWRPLVWLRYSLWIPFYPLGIFFEEFALIKTFSLAASSGRLSTSLPNAFNFSFYFPFYVVFHSVILLFAGFYLMKHMWILRQRKLHPRSAKAKQQ